MSSFRALHDRVTLRRLTAEERSAGGISADTVQQKPADTQVITVGRGIYNGRGQILVPEERPGDRGLFSRWRGTDATFNSEERTHYVSTDTVCVDAVEEQALEHILGSYRAAIGLDHVGAPSSWK
jgi:chaperonin GroES